MDWSSKLVLNSVELSLVTSDATAAVKFKNKYTYCKDEQIEHILGVLGPSNPISVYHTLGIFPKITVHMVPEKYGTVVCVSGLSNSDKVWRVAVDADPKNITRAADYVLSAWAEKCIC